MFCWLDVKKKHLAWFYSLLCKAFFLNFIFCLQDGCYLKAHASQNGMDMLLCNKSIQNSGKSKCTSLKFCLPAGTFQPVEVKRNQIKTISNKKTSYWLLGKISKRHNFRYFEWNYAHWKAICSFKSNKICGKIHWCYHPQFSHQIMC